MSNKNNKLHFIYLFFCKTINVFKVGSRKKKKRKEIQTCYCHIMLI